MTSLINIFWLGLKEIRSVLSDVVLVLFVCYAFTLTVYQQANGTSNDVNNAPIAFVDDDRSSLSNELINAFYPPRFQYAAIIPPTEIEPAMDQGRYMFVVVIPTQFEQNLVAGRNPDIQLNIDATAMTQAGNGAIYIENIIAQEVAKFQTGSEAAARTPVKFVISAKFNPNLYSSWFSSVMQVINNITMLAVILTGAALIREREQGTVEHLLVMPVVPAEIMLAKIVANALVILVAAGLSLAIVVQWWLNVPIAGSLTLFLAGAALYAFTVAALGILLGTQTTSMGQFGLLAIPVLVIMQLLSGGTTPMESMPVWLQYVMRIVSPTPHFVAFAQAVLYRGAGFSIVWPWLLAIAAIGSVYFAFSLQRFRRVIFGA